MTDAVYPVPAEWAEKATDRRRPLCRQCTASWSRTRTGFWRREAQRIDWIRPFTTVKETSFHEADFGIRWFADGTLNLSANCLDRHLRRAGDVTAIIWEPDDPAERGPDDQLSRAAPHGLPLRQCAEGAGRRSAATG